MELMKFPRTPHLEGSALQIGDDGSDQMPLAALAGRHAVIEEKVDAANCGLSLSSGGALLLQSKGHFLVGGGSERQFNLLKPWASRHIDSLMAVLEDRWVMYGEWMYSRHSIWYDRLPSFFLEFDIRDRSSGRFLSTKRRREMLRNVPIVSVPVLYEGPMPGTTHLLNRLIVKSLCKSEKWRSNFEAHVMRRGLPLELTWQQTTPDDESEGLYVKIENDDFVEARYKFVRSGFIQTILDSGSHHLHRPILPNLLAPGVDMYAAQSTVTWEALGLQTVRSIEELKALPAREGTNRWVESRRSK